MVKKIVTFLLSLLLLCLTTPNIKAEGEFTSTVNVNYTILPSGITHVTHRIKLENLYSDFYASSYQLVLNNIKTENVSAQENGRALKIDSSKNANQTILKVNFNTPVVGKNKYHDFTVAFDNPDFAQHTGEIWEISIPRLQNDTTFNTYDVSLTIPQSFGNEAFMSPRASSSSSLNGKTTYFFNKAEVEKTGITAGFGSFQVFSFSLNYHLENPLATTSQTEISLPPDTPSQKMYYFSLNPRPLNVRIDTDGNWLASYKLTPRQKLDISTSGFVQIFASPTTFPKPSAEDLAQNLRSSSYWQTEDSRIHGLAQKYTTPKAIYTYVSSFLTYDYQKVLPNIERLGAIKALAQPSQAMCMEYTDLFIAIARSAGIPAREIEGYAYTDNKNLQPLALVDDVLHAWPEYWDKTAQVWIPIDPTWGSTTGGVDYFSKLDLRHFTFVIHGTDPSKPYPPGSYKLGSNPQKDVFVNFSQLPAQRVSRAEITTAVSQLIPFFPLNLRVRITNSGPSSLTNITPEILFDGVSVKKDYREIVPPFSYLDMDVSIPFSFLGQKTPNQITILAGDNHITIPGYKTRVLTYNLIGMSVIIIILVGYILNALFHNRSKKITD